METLRKMPMLSNPWPMLLNNLFNRDSFNEGNLNFFDQNNTVVPAVNIKESAEAFTIEMLAPGMAKNDFKIEVDKNTLLVSAEKTSKNESDNDGNYHRREFSFQSLRRSFTIPGNIVDTDRISAQYSDGILRLEIPKKEEALPKPPKMIEIS
jgi:HSP20 family protein